MSRKNMPLVIGGVITLLLVGVLGYVLFSAQSSYATANSELQTKGMRMKRLLDRPVYPSDANVGTMESQLGIYEDYLEDLFGAVSEGQTELEAVNRDHFRQVLQQTLRGLYQAAHKNSIKLPPEFAFGFQRYASGVLPAEEDLERLIDQLQTVKALCEILYESGVGELVSIERTVFEKDAQTVAQSEEEYTGARRRGGRMEEAVVAAPATDLVVDEDGLFSKERYVLSYKAQDKANWNVLSRLAQGAPFTIVSRMEVQNNERPSVSLPKPAEAPALAAGARPGGPAMRGGAGAEEDAVLPRQLRIVAGQELALVKLELDVYRFLQAAAAKGEE